MRSTPLTLALAAILTAGCCCRAASPPAPAPVLEEAPAPAPVAKRAPGPTRLRYYDIQDFPVRNGVLMVRGDQAQLREVDAHLAAVRDILRRTPPPLPSATKAEIGPRLTVQIHTVADIVASMPDIELVGPAGSRTQTPQALLLAWLRARIGETAWKDAVVRFQGEQNLVVKATPPMQEEIARALEELRGRVQAADER